ncbi:DUF58 domain-containing protein [Bacillus songklensis]|uniref:DUF58 domain-containing protein n=1 Tax=Bacillus songklensis TaxID=1069116 RepID=A0ABV8B0Q1_9BACI
MKKKIWIQVIHITVILVLAAITFAYAMFQGGFVSWFLFYSFMPFAVYSLMVCVYPLHHLHVERELTKQTYQAGDDFVATIIIKRKGHFPLLYLIIQDDLPAHLETHYGQNASKIMIFPFFRKEIQIQYSLLHLPRGEHSFDYVRLKTGDFLGIVEKETYYENKVNYLVYPKMIKVRVSDLFTDYEQGELSSHSFLRQEGGFVSGIREYQAGDRFSWIDWKSSAKRNTLISKEFEQKKTSHLTVVLDGLTPYGLEPRITLTASILSAYVKAGGDIQFISLGKNVFVQPLQNPEYHLRQALYHLAFIQGEKQGQFSEMLAREWGKWQLKTNILLIVSEMNEQLMFMMEAMVRQQCHLFIMMVKENERTLSPKEQALVKRLKSKRVQIKVTTESEFLDAIAGVNSQ